MVEIVADRALVRRVAGLEHSGAVISVPRAHRRGRWEALIADDVLDALDGAGRAGVVLARPAAVDPGAAALPGLARILGIEVVLLPADADRAAWVVGLAAHLERTDRAAAIRALQALAGLAAVAADGEGAGRGTHAVARPAVVLRWARRGWRPCARCGGGGRSGARCGRCGGAMAVAA